MHTGLTVQAAQQELHGYWINSRKDVARGYDKHAWQRQLFFRVRDISLVALAALASYALYFPLLSDPSYSGQPVLALISAVVYGGLGAMLVVIPLSSWRVTHLAYQFFAQRSHRQILNQLKRIPDYLQDVAVPSHLLKRLIQLPTYPQFQTALLKKMNLQQLKVAHEGLGAARFNILVDELPALRKTLEKVLALNSPLEINRAIARLERHKKEDWYPPFLGQLYQALERKGFDPTVKAALLNAAPGLKQITIKFEDQKFQPLVITQATSKLIQGAVLLAGFGLINPAQFAPEEGPQFPSELTIPLAFLSNEKDYGAFKRILSRLSGENCSVDLETWLFDLNYAYQWFGTEGLQAVERDLVSVSFIENFENYHKLAQFYSNNIFPSHLQQRVLEKLTQLFYAKNPSEEKKRAFEEQYGYSLLVQTDKSHLLEKLKEQKTVEHLLWLYPLCKEEEYAKLFAENAAGILTGDNIHKLYEFFSKRKEEIKAKAPYAACLDFAQKLSASEKVKIWEGFAAVPMELRG